MTITKILPLIALGIASGQAAYADAPKLVEVPVRRVLFPVTGYDDNDHVQVMIEGDLPDPCYVLGKQTLRRDRSGTIVISQYAWRRQGGACDTGDLLGESPFSEEVSIGRLRAGEYRVAFRPKDDRIDYRKLTIAIAQLTTTDNLSYARVTGLHADDVILDGESPRLSFSGSFTRSCSHLQEPVAIERQGDTIVIRPVEVSHGSCDSSLRNFEKTINLEALPPGKYLVHIRSKNGKAIEKTFSVLGERV